MAELKQNTIAGFQAEHNCEYIVDAASSFACGVMHQIPTTKNINLRLVGGLNLDTFVFDDIADGGASFDAATLLGLRAGGGLDFKLFRSVQGVAKIHKNLNGIRFISKTGSGELDIEDFEVNGANAWDFGAGLRFEARIYCHRRTGRTLKSELPVYLCC